MGTNFYFFTRNKEKCEILAPRSYHLTDDPDFGYEIHIAKTSCGWLPLFQAHDGIRSVADMKKIYDEGDFSIVDEYGDYYDWPAFEDRVLKFNGGVNGAIPKEKIKVDKNSRFYDSNMPDHIPVSHFEYANGYYAKDYFKDPEGYEFDWQEFC